MEFHVWGKLDDGGRIQTVQSRCTTPAFQECDAGGSHWDRGMGHVTTGANGEKLVDYSVKKDLVNKLDAKIDEMSLIMMQMGELSKRVKIQEKLITEYEAKYARQSERLRKVEAENAALRNSHSGMAQSKRSLSSGNLPASTQPKCVRSSVTEIKMTVQCSTSQEAEHASWPLAPGNRISGINANDGERMFKDIHDNSNNASCDMASDDQVDGAPVKRPNTLTLACNENHCGASAGNDTHEGSVDTVDGFFLSYPSNDSTVNSQDVRNSLDNEIPEKVSPPACDTDGYLIFSGKSTEENSSTGQCTDMDMDDFSACSSRPKSPCLSVLSGSGSNGPMSCSSMSDNASDSSSRMNNDRMLIMECEDGIHGRWVTGMEFKISCSPQCGSTCHHEDTSPLDIPVFNEDYADEYSYAEISSDQLVRESCTSNPQGSTASPQLDLDKYSSRPPPPTPPPRSKRSHIMVKVETVSNQGNQGYIQMSNSSTHVQLPSTPVQPVQVPKIVVGASATPDRTTTPTRTSSEVTLPSLPFTGLLEEGVMPQPQTFTRCPHSSPDMRKDDRCNNILRTMRTTMEWNKAKKTLMSMSHTCTVDQVEQTLRVLVQDAYSAFKNIQNQDKKKLERCSPEKLVRKVRRELKNKGHEILTDAFLEKCAHLWTTSEKTGSP